MLRVRLGGHDVTSAFAVRSNGRFEGIVHGMKDGRETSSPRGAATGPARRSRSRTTDRGPVFGRPPSRSREKKSARRGRRSTSIATTDLLQLHVPVDEPVSLFAPYDPAHPPSDVATTTTDDGVTVPFIVRIETGYEDPRPVQVATLFSPASRDGVRSQKQFAHKLLITHGASCDVDYEPGNAPSVTSYNPADLLRAADHRAGRPVGDGASYALAHGFVVMFDRAGQQRPQLRRSSRRPSR